jgi:hypothetical protein
MRDRASSFFSSAASLLSSGMWVPTADPAMTAVIEQRSQIAKTTACRRVSPGTSSEARIERGDRLGGSNVTASYPSYALDSTSSEQGLARPVSPARRALRGQTRVLGSAARPTIRLECSSFG